LQDRQALPTINGMAEASMHRIEDDLAEEWLEEWTASGISEIESYLAKHAAFLAYLDGLDS
jgi:hypothetical protein